MALVLLLCKCFHSFPFLLLCSGEVICALYALWLVISHGLKSIYKVYKLEATIDVLIVSLDPIDDINVLDFRSACELTQEYPHIIAVNLAMSILVNHPEDRQDRVVELADELLLEHLHAFQTLNLSAQNSNFFIQKPI